MTFPLSPTTAHAVQNARAHVEASFGGLITLELCDGDKLMSLPAFTLWAGRRNVPAFNAYIVTSVGIRQVARYDGLSEPTG